jgi:hypothetical protein
MGCSGMAGRDPRHLSRLRQPDAMRGPAVLCVGQGLRAGPLEQSRYLAPDPEWPWFRAASICPCRSSRLCRGAKSDPRTDTKNAFIGAKIDPGKANISSSIHTSSRMSLIAQERKGREFAEQHKNASFQRALNQAPCRNAKMNLSPHANGRSPKRKK